MLHVIIIWAPLLLAFNFHFSLLTTQLYIGLDFLTTCTVRFTLHIEILNFVQHVANLNLLIMAGKI